MYNFSAFTSRDSAINGHLFFTFTVLFENIFSRLLPRPCIWIDLSKGDFGLGTVLDPTLNETLLDLASASEIFIRRMTGFFHEKSPLYVGHKKLHQSIRKFKTLLDANQTNRFFYLSVISKFTLMKLSFTPETLPRGQSSALYLSLMETHSCDGLLAGAILFLREEFQNPPLRWKFTGWNLFHLQQPLFKKKFSNEILKCNYPWNNWKLCVPLLIPRGCVSLSCWTRLTLWRFVFSRPTLQAGGQVRPRFLPPGSGWFGLSQQRSQDRHPCR